MGGEFENTPKMAFLQWGIAVLAIIQVLRIKKTGSFNWKITPLDFPIILFYVFCLLSLLQAANPYQGVLSLLHWAAVIIFYFFLVNTLKKEETIGHIFFVTALSVCLVSLIGIQQKLGIDPFSIGISEIPQLTVPASTFSNHNMGSQFVALAIPLTIGSIIISKQFWMKFVSAACFLISVLYLIYTGTRSAWLAALAVVLLFFIIFPLRSVFLTGVKKHVFRTIFMYAVILCILLSALFWVTPVRDALHIDTGKAKERLFSIGAGIGGTSKLRTIWWINTWEMVKDHRWWGVGMGNFKLMYPPYHRAVGSSKPNFLKDVLKDVEKDWSFSEAKQLNRVHNDHLQMLVELGFFGFCAWLSMFGAFFYMFWKIFSNPKNEDIQLKAIFICLGTVAFIIIAFFTFPVERAMPPVYLFTFFALMSFLYAENEQGNVKTWKFGFQAGVRALVSWLNRRFGFQVVARALIALVLAGFLFSSVYFIRKIVLSDKYFVEALTMGERGKIDQANALLEKAKIFSMFNFNISALLARNYTIQGKYKEAIDEYKESFRAHPYNTNAFLNTGYCYLKLNNYDEAEKKFKEYLDIMPDSSKGHNNIGIVYFSKKEYDKAIEHYKKAFELESTYAEPYFNLANLYRSLKRFKEAMQEYEMVLKLRPDMDAARRFLSSLYIETGNFEKARETITPLLKKEKKAADDYIIQGNIHQKQGRYKKALPQYQKALQFVPQDAFIHHNIGLIHYYMQNFSQAEKFLRKALSLNADIAESYNLLGQLYLRRKDDKGALELFQKTLEINPKLSDAQFNVGTIYLRLGKYELAKKEYEKTLKIDPGFSLAHYNLATILMHKGESEKAVFHFEKSLENPSELIDVQLAKQFIANLKESKTDVKQKQ
jgi:tetratricopeptide (TPR) repeat protein